MKMKNVEEVKAETVDAIAAARETAALRLRTLLDEAATLTGQICRTPAEWQGLRPLLESLWFKRLKAEGLLENRAQRRALDELDRIEDELGRLAAELIELERCLAARYAADRAEWNPQNSARQAAFDRQLVAAGTSGSFFEQIQALLPEAAEIRQWNERISRHQPNGQVNHDFIVSPGQYLQVGDLIELAQRSVMLHFNVSRGVPDKRTWRRM